jgi:hypothetical protein
MQETRYITNETGERTDVFLPIEEYVRLVDALEELEDAEHIRAAKETRARIERGKEEPVPFDQAMREIRAGKVPEDR